MTENYDESEIKEIYKTAIDNTISEYSIDFADINVNKLQRESKEALENNKFRCSECDRKGGVKGDNQLFLTLDRHMDDFDSKEDAINSSNLTPLCKDCFNSEGTSEAVSTAPSQKTVRTSERAKYSLSKFERFVSENTPSLLFKRHIDTLAKLFGIFTLVSLGYGYMYTNSATEFYFTLLGIPFMVLNTLIVDYTLAVFVLILPLIGLYTLLEHYQPVEYFTPNYMTSYSTSSISIPYILHPIILLVSTVVSVGLTIGFTTEYYTVPIQNAQTIAGISYVIFMVSLFFIPFTFGRIVRGDQSTILARSLASKSELKALEHDDIVLTESGGRKGKVNRSYIKEAVENSDTLVGSYYFPVFWRFMINVSVMYILLILWGGLFKYVSLIAEAGILLTPSIIIGVYLMFRYYKYRKVAKEFEQSSDQVKSESRIEW